MGHASNPAGDAGCRSTTRPDRQHKGAPAWPTLPRGSPTGGARTRFHRHSGLTQTNPRHSGRGNTQCVFAFLLLERRISHNAPNSTTAAYRMICIMCELTSL